jgi:hypothetical protein
MVQRGYYASIFVLSAYFFPMRTAPFTLSTLVLCFRNARPIALFR